MKEKELYHLGVPADRVPSRVLLVDPGVDQDRVAAALDDLEPEIRRREYRSVQGLHRGLEVLVCSSGFGGPPLAIAVEELARAGASAFVLLQRLDPVPQRDTVVTGAVRDEGTTGHYAPPTFPAVPDVHLVAALREHLGDHVYGLLRSVDVIHEQLTAPTGTFGLDLQAAPLFVVGAALGVRTASVAIGASASPDVATRAALDALVAPVPVGQRTRP